MAISLNRYVSITSGVGAAAAVSTRELIGRFFSQNPLIPTGTVLEFSSSDDVESYFGSASTEFKRAEFYFGWISKNITTPQKISFYFWPAAATGSLVFGKPGTYALGAFTAITTGDLTLTLGGFTHHLTGINLSSAGSLAAVASAVQTAVNSFSGGGSAWTGATVAFDATRGSFNLTSGATGPDTVSVAAGGTTDLAGPLGWLTGAVLSNGAAAQSVTGLLVTSINVSNNFGSFAFIPVLTQAQIVEAAAWNNTQNVDYMYSVPVLPACASSVSAAVIDIGGTTLTLAPLPGEYPEQAPMMIEAATDYTKRNSVQNYMFQIFGLTPSVTTDADADLYDGLTVNYYGQTQTAGQLIQFYQRGVMTGLPVDPADQNVYANEQWLKDAASAAIMTLLLALAQVPANAQGRSQILAVLQGVINQALFNGTVSVGKPLTTAQKLYIGNATGDENAWQQVQNIGYWVDVQIVPFVEDGVTKFKAVYTLIYSKDDIIRKVEGSDILI